MSGERNENSPTGVVIESENMYESVLDGKTFETIDDMVRAVDDDAIKKYVQLKAGQDDLSMQVLELRGDILKMADTLDIIVEKIGGRNSRKSLKKKESPKKTNLKGDSPSMFINRLSREPSEDSDSDSEIVISEDGDDKDSSSGSSSSSSSSKSTSSSRKDATKKKEDQRRRETIFSKPGATVKSSTSQKSNVLILKSITREHFPNVGFKSLNLEHICIFLDEFDRILERHPDQGLRMIDFVDPKVYSRLTVAASELKYVSAKNYGLGVTNLSDKKLKKCILYLVRAISAEDFIKKIKSIQFPSPEFDRTSFSPSALTFNTLFDRATIFAHKFNRILQMIAKMARAQDIPPLYKEGKTLGIIDYFLAAWPNDSGNNLYSKLSINHNTLRHMKNFTDFTYKFFKVLRPYKKLKEGVDDLDSVLSVKKRNDNERPSQSSFKYEKGGKKFTKVHNVQDDDISLDEIYTKPLSDMDEEINPLSTETQREEDASEPEEMKLRARTNEEEEESHELAAVEVQKAANAPNFPCWFNYKHGKCTKQGCKLDHSREAMTKYQDTRLQELIKSSYADSESVFLQKAQRYFKMRGSLPGLLKPKP